MSRVESQTIWWSLPAFLLPPFRGPRPFGLNFMIRQTRFYCFVYKSCMIKYEKGLLRTTSNYLFIFSIVDFFLSSILFTMCVVLIRTPPHTQMRGVRGREVFILLPGGHYLNHSSFPQPTAMGGCAGGGY